MADENLSGFDINDKFFKGTSDPFNFSPGLSGVATGVEGSIETLELAPKLEHTYSNACSTMKTYSDYKAKLASSDSWSPAFSSNDNELFKKYVEKYKEETGIDLNNLDNYSFYELVEKGTFQPNGDLISDRDILTQVIKEEGFNDYIDSGYGTDVFCSWVRDNASIKFSSGSTIMDIKLSEVDGITDSHTHKYVESDDENNVLATDESESLIQTTNQIYAAMTPDYVEVLSVYLKTKPISEVIDENGKMHIDENDFKQFVLKHNSEDPEHQYFGGDEYSITKQTHALVDGVNNLDVKYDSINEERHKTGTFDDLYNEEKEFSNASDYDQIILNDFNNILTNGVKEHFGRDSNMYNVYCKYLEGKKLDDIIKDGKLICSKDDLLAVAAEEGIELFDGDVYNMLQYFDSMGINDLYSDSATLRNLKIQKIISSDSGYDSIVFEKGDEVIVTNTCADGESFEDCTAIGYSAIKLLCGDNLDLYNLLASAFAGTTAQIPDFMSYDDISKAKSYYDEQIKESYDNVLEQLKLGKKVHINCFSLGGGTGFDTFMRIMSDDSISEDYKSRLTCSGFNPYFNMFEADSFFVDKDGHEAAVKKVFDKYGDQIELRCVEGDVVSQFNTVIDGELGNHITYIKAAQVYDSEQGKMVDAPLTMDDFDSEGHEGNIMDLIVNPSSRHSTSAIDLESFNNGYLIENGKRLTMNEILGNNEPSNDLKVIYKGLVSPYLSSLKGDNADYADIIDAIDSYLQTHVGENISYDGLIDAVSPGVVKLAKKMAPEVAGFGGHIGNFLMNDDVFEEKLSNYFKSDAGKAKIKEILKLIGNQKPNQNLEGDIRDIIEPVVTDLYYDSLYTSVFGGDIDDPSILEIQINSYMNPPIYDPDNPPSLLDYPSGVPA